MAQPRVTKMDDKGTSTGPRGGWRGLYVLHMHMHSVVVLLHVSSVTQVGSLRQRTDGILEPVRETVVPFMSAHMAGES